MGRALPLNRRIRMGWTWQSILFKEIWIWRKWTLGTYKKWSIMIWKCWKAFKMKWNLLVYRWNGYRVKTIQKWKLKNLERGPSSKSDQHPWKVHNRNFKIGKMLPSNHKQPSRSKKSLLEATNCTWLEWILFWKGQRSPTKKERRSLTLETARCSPRFRWGRVGPIRCKKTLLVLDKSKLRIYTRTGNQYLS